MNGLVMYKARHKDTQEWVSSDEIKSVRGEIALLGLWNSEYHWLKVNRKTLCRGSDAVDKCKQVIYENDIVEFKCPTISKNMLKGNVYYSMSRHQWRCRLLLHNDEAVCQERYILDNLIDFDLAFILNNGSVKVIGNRYDGEEYEH